MEPVREEIEIVTGRGFFDLRGGECDAALLIEERPVALNWDDCQGSIGQYLVRARVPDYGPALAALRDTLDGGWSPYRTAAEQLDLLLDLFSPGRYALVCGLAEDWWNCFDVPAADDPRDATIEFYPCDTQFVPTRSPSSLNAGRVDYFADRIRSGVRPVAVTATVGSCYCEFVVDGHHKLAAYKRESVAPMFVSIRRLDPAVQFDESFGHGHPKAGDYRKFKRAGGAWQ